ncbi:type II toxin-antitoxin system Phd/YefM family antitoxin [Bifidobacterium simiiventris]|uniref:type II toxin-antitoxin system Phd/YefM family antitoxin n=1 Tax=Bifidobacterium simiiventris TaxID=2834434 RepID=UPI001C580573|nr:type II toxin-antitoxin system Phd/YefM family antitoxin [Bifidobacterium simiiventris]MBW3077798.1 type II toxin-antitoxin system Phd/YefM family antitoxin [Bifidobacterium simiiventris]
MADQMIRPVSDLRNNFADISRIVHETGEPVFLTKNGFGDMVVLSMEAYENLQLDSRIYDMLLEGEREAETTGKRFSPKEAMASMRAAIDGAMRV